MKCPICGKEMDLQKKQVGTDENGKPIFNQYAVCRDCKKQWNLDKQRAKKQAAKKAVEQKPVKEEKSSDTVLKSDKKTMTSASTKQITAAAVKSADTAHKKQAAKSDDTPKKQTAKTDDTAKKRPVNSDGTPKKRPVNPDGTPKKRPVNSDGTPKKHPVNPDGTPKKRPVNSDGTPKKRPVNLDGTPKKRPGNPDATQKKQSAKVVSPETEEQRYGNIPSEKVRAKHERAVKQGYADMLATESERKDRKNTTEKPVTKATQKKMDMHEEDYDDYDEDYEPVAKFRVLRILFGILSIAAFGYLGYTALQNGLANPSENLTSGTGFTYIVLALCMLVSGLLLLILQKSNTVFAFLLPMAIYLAAAVFAFLKRAGEPFLLYIAVAGVVLALLFLILTIASRKVSDEDEDYEDEEEEEEDDDYDISFDDYE